MANRWHMIQKLNICYFISAFELYRLFMAIEEHIFCFRLACFVFGTVDTINLLFIYCLNLQELVLQHCHNTEKKKLNFHLFFNCFNFWNWSSSAKFLHKPPNAFSNTNTKSKYWTWVAVQKLMILMFTLHIMAENVLASLGYVVLSTLVCFLW